MVTRPGAARPGVLRRYILFQIPGAILAAGVVLALVQWARLPGWAATALWLAWVPKDVLLYPTLRHAYEPSESLPAERLVGRRGVVTRPVAPVGYVRVGGELWRAHALDADGRLDAGTAVEIVEVSGLMLTVKEVPR